MESQRDKSYGKAGDLREAARLVDEALRKVWTARLFAMRLQRPGHVRELLMAEQKLGNVAGWLAEELREVGE